MRVTAEPCGIVNWGVYIDGSRICEAYNEQIARAIAAALSAVESASLVEYHEYIEADEVAKLDLTDNGDIMADLPIERVEVNPATLTTHWQAQDLIKEAAEAMEKIV